jgi:hypothetical protein
MRCPKEHIDDLNRVLRIKAREKITKEAATNAVARFKDKIGYDPDGDNPKEWTTQYGSCEFRPGLDQKATLKIKQVLKLIDSDPDALEQILNMTSFRVTDLKKFFQKAFDRYVFVKTTSPSIAFKPEPSLVADIKRGK